MSERPSWKKPPAPSPQEAIEQRTKDLVAQDRTPSLSGRAMRRGGVGTPRSVIYSFKMAIPKKRRKKR